LGLRAKDVAVKTRRVLFLRKQRNALGLKQNLSTSAKFRSGEQIKDQAFSDLVKRADGLILVVPEYNHGYPGLLKHALDMNLEEYIHKAVGICGVSAGPFGGTRVIEALLPVMRELGLVTIFTDVNFANAGEIFGEDGRLLDEGFVRRTAKFLDELIWMARVLRHGRENVPPA
jgi:NAD(P)H-dependent FMN reductase